MRLLLTGGGTAGHVNPALAIAEIFKKNCPSAEILFAGTDQGIERRLVAEAGYPFFAIEAMGLSRSLSPKNLRALYLALRGPHTAARLLRRLEPHLVVGTGGYVSWPILSAAARLGIPCAVHESNASPGLTVRRLAPRVDAVLLNFQEAAEQLPKGVHAVRVGNPLRSGFSSLSREEARRRLGIPPAAHLLLSFGGSLGAEAINTAMLRLISEYTAKAPSVFHIHGCGARYYESYEKALRARLGDLPHRIRVSAYLEQMPELMAAADLIICRAGAMTVSEVARAGRASILIPSPNVAGDHQTKNAKALADLGAAVLMPEDDCESKLTETVARLLSAHEDRARMEAAAKAFGLPDANKRVYLALMELLKTK